MNHGRPINILILLEIVAFVLVCVLGVVSVLKPKPEKKVPVNEQRATETEADTTEVAVIEPVSTEEIVVPSEPVTYTLPVDIYSEEVLAKLESMNVEEKVASLFVVTPETLTGEDRVNIAGDVTRQALTQMHISGLVYSSYNYDSDEQMTDLLNGTYSMSTEVMEYTPYIFYTEGDEIAYSSEGNIQSIVASVGVEDTEAETPQDITGVPVYGAENMSLSEDTAIVMLSNEMDSDISGEAGLPICLSKKAVYDLRVAKEYHGLIMTGRLADADITGTYSAGEAAVAAVLAGVDIIYEPEDITEAYNAVLAAVEDGEIAMELLDQAAGRILIYRDGLGEIVTGSEAEEQSEGADNQTTSQQNNSGATQNNGGAAQNNGGATQNNGGATQNNGGAAQNNDGATQNNGGAAQNTGGAITPAPEQNTGANTNQNSQAGAGTEIPSQPGDAGNGVVSDQPANEGATDIGAPAVEMVVPESTQQPDAGTGN